MVREGLGQRVEGSSVRVEPTGLTTAGWAEVQLVVPADTGGNGRQDVGWYDQTRFVETALRRYPGKRDEQGRRFAHKVGSVHQDPLACVWLGELSCFDLDPDGRSRGQAADNALVGPVVWARARQAPRSRPPAPAPN